jgi:hypothetical protein
MVFIVSVTYELQGTHLYEDGNEKGKQNRTLMSAEKLDLSTQ